MRIEATPLSFAHLREVNLLRCVEGFKHPLESWSTEKWLVAVGGEVGEALNIVKKINRVSDGLGQFHDNTVDNLRERLGCELADCVIYLDLLMARLRLQISEAFVYDDSGKVVRDMARLRLNLWAQVGGVPELVYSAAELMTSAGELAHEVICDTVDREDDEAPFHDGGIALYAAAAKFMTDIDTLACAADIDLGAAIISTFNAKSVELGVPHRIEAR